MIFFKTGDDPGNLPEYGAFYYGEIRESGVAIHARTPFSYRYIVAYRFPSSAMIFSGFVPL
jgi:hypothetical protein